MAAGVRALVGSDWGVATTGVAGPTEQEGKKIGTVFVAVAGPQGPRDVVARQLHLDGDRAEIRAAACTAAAALLLETVTGEG
jgi:nicotinamide-nucleotide amidase